MWINGYCLLVLRIASTQLLGTFTHCDEKICKEKDSDHHVDRKKGGIENDAMI